MVKCLINNGTQEDAQQLFAGLTSLIRNVFPQAKIDIWSSDHYWKCPEDREEIYVIYSDQPLRIIDLTSKIPLTWDYHESRAHDADADMPKPYRKEEAIWNQIGHPEEVFLFPKINWLHAYSWPREVESNHK